MYSNFVIINKIQNISSYVIFTDDRTVPKYM